MDKVANYLKSAGLSDKDEQTLISMPNKILSGSTARVMLDRMPDSILDFYEKNASKIKGKVIVIRSKADEDKASQARNTESKVLFVFSEYAHPSNYFTSSSYKLTLPNALLKRAK